MRIGSEFGRGYGLPVTAMCPGWSGLGGNGPAGWGRWRTGGPVDWERPMANETGTILTCTNADCGCRLRIEEPCPHGDTYTCACGHQFEEMESSTADLPA